MDPYERKPYTDLEESPLPTKIEHGDVQTTETTEVGAQNQQRDKHTSLHRGLKARHITMIAIGGAIGTGLIIGTCV